VGPRASLEGFEENVLAPAGIRTPDSEARDLSLYTYLALSCCRNVCQEHSPSDIYRTFLCRSFRVWRKHFLLMTGSLLHACYLAMVCSEFWLNFLNLFLIGRKERQLRSPHYSGAIWWIRPWTAQCLSASGLQYCRLCCRNSR
jgi:hypothetical protein